MPLVRPMRGMANDLIMIFSQKSPQFPHGYDWQENFRVNVGPGTRGVIPRVVRAEEFVDNPFDGHVITIMTYIPSFIERQQGVIAIRANIAASIKCRSKSLEIAEGLADTLVTILFTEEDDTGAKNYISPNFNTINQLIPARTGILSPVKDENGYWSVIVDTEGRSQQSNTN